MGLGVTKYKGNQQGSHSKTFRNCKHDKKKPPSPRAFYRCRWCLLETKSVELSDCLKFPLELMYFHSGHARTFPSSTAAWARPAQSATPSWPSASLCLDSRCLSNPPRPLSSSVQDITTAHPDLSERFGTPKGSRCENAQLLTCNKNEFSLIHFFFFSTVHIQQQEDRDRCPGWPYRAVVVAVVWPRPWMFLLCWVILSSAHILFFLLLHCAHIDTKHVIRHNCKRKDLKCRRNKSITASQSFHRSNIAEWNHFRRWLKNVLIQIYQKLLKRNECHDVTVICLTMQIFDFQSLVA